MPIAIIAGGRSLVDCDLERLRGLCHVIAVKASIFDMPWADCGVGIDWPRFREWLPLIAQSPMRVYWAMDPTQWRNSGLTKPGNVTFLRKLDGDYSAASSDMGALICGGTSGFGALNLALMLRRESRFPVFLFGYDYRQVGDSFHRGEQHYGKKRTQRLSYWHNWAKSYGIAAPFIAKRGVEIVNASIGSAITCFPRVTYNDAVDHLDRLGRARGGGLRGGALDHAVACEYEAADPGLSSELG